MLTQKIFGQTPAPRWAVVRQEIAILRAGRADSEVQQEVAAFTEQLINLLAIVWNAGPKERDAKLAEVQKFLEDEDN